jgi:glucose/arabinose dehydrogenase
MEGQMRATVRLAVALAALLVAVLPARASADTTAAGSLRLVAIGSFDDPVYATSPPGDAGRIFVVEQGSSSSQTARIRIVRDGQVLADPFLTLSGVKAGGEQGLLSMAFAPDYAASGRFYVYYNDVTACTGSGCAIAVDEFVRADPEHANHGSRRRLLTIPHPDFGNHNGGQLQFGPDGLLYLGPGDGGSVGDPRCNAQNPQRLLGKLLRIDPRVPGAAPQVYALGLRNPFRFSFDRLTGDLTLGDVGQGAQEEVDFLPAGTPPGANFGWNVFEGTAPYSSACASPPLPGYVAPALTYPTHVNGTCVVTGGYVVRDVSVAELLGRYLYGDFCVGQLRSAVLGPGSASGDGPTGLQVSSLSSFGEDALCRVYAVSLAGPVYRLESATPAAPPGCQSLPVPDRASPGLTRVGLLRARFAVSRARTAVVAQVRRPPRPRRGTAFRYTLSERATVTFRIYRTLTGRRRGRRCLPPIPALRRARRCVRYVLAGTLVRRSVRPGRRSTPFSGRIGRRPLRLGRYRATLRARDAARNLSAGRAVTFTVVRP